MPEQEIIKIEGRTITLCSPRGKCWKYNIKAEVPERTIQELASRQKAGHTSLGVAHFSGTKNSNLLILEEIGL